MQFDNQERKPIFYVFLFGMLIFSIIFFVHNVKKAINSGNAKEAQTTKEISQELENY